MSRPDRWEDRLIATVEQYRSRPFEWGVCDCVTFASDCVIALRQTREHCALFEGKYSDARTYVRLVEELGGFEAALSKAGGRSVPVGLTQRGDVLVVVNFEGREILSVNIGGGMLACVGEQGLVFREIDSYPDTKTAWRFD